MLLAGTERVKRKVMRVILNKPASLEKVAPINQRPRDFAAGTIQRFAQEQKDLSY